MLPVWFSTDTRVQHETKMFGYAVLAAFVLIVILGYTVPWLNLLLLPLLLPTVILPALKPIAMGRIVYLDKDGNPIEPAASRERPHSYSEEPTEDEGIAPVPGSRR